MNNIEQDYLKLLHDVLINGVEKQDRTGTGTISVFGRQIRHDMKLGFPLLTTKKMPFKTIATELLWFLSGNTNIKFLIDNGCHIWNGDAIKNYEKHNGEIDWGPFITKEEAFIESMKDEEFARKWGDLGPVYGAQWKKWSKFDYHYGSISGDLSIDQIADLIKELKANPDSRRLMVNAWNVGDLDEMTLPPCHYGFQVYTRELSHKEKVDWVIANCYETGMERYFVEQMNDEQFHNDYFNTPKRAISLMWNQRSVDTFLGLPFNIASYGLLLEIIAKAVNMVPDQLIGNLGDVHLYSNHIEQAKEQLTRQLLPLPTLNINTEFWPTESGECGVGEIDAEAVFKGFEVDVYCKCFFEDLQLGTYQYHPHIKAPLSN
jgi:thymidylate synthase